MRNKGRMISKLVGLGVLILILFSCGLSTPPSTTNQQVFIDSCCRHCLKGKACGDSCISRSYTCHKPVGCACDY